jgi:hypothetical protein
MDALIKPTPEEEEARVHIVNLIFKHDLEIWEPKIASALVNVSRNYIGMRCAFKNSEKKDDLMYQKYEQYEKQYKKSLKTLFKNQAKGDCVEKENH